MTGDLSKKIETFHCLYVALILLNSCVSNTKDEQIKVLESRIKSDSILLSSLNTEMDGINNVLNEAENLNDYFMSNRSINRINAINKIIAMDSLLSGSLNKLDSLATAIEKSSSMIKGNKVIENGIFAKKSEIGFASDYYHQLQLNIQLLTNENINLVSIIKQKERELIEKDNVILEIKAEREKQEERLNELKYQIQLAEQRLSDSERKNVTDSKDAIEKTAKLYYETGLEFKSIHDNISGLSTLFGGKSSKKNLITQAYEYFKKSYNLGYYAAKREMDILKAEKKYSKYLE